MKRLFSIAVLMAAILSFSFTAQASPQHAAQVYPDVGKTCIFMTDAFHADVTVVTKYDISVQTGIVHPVASPAIAAVPFRYEKRKFVSFNKDRNRYLYQRYGQKHKERTTAKVINDQMKRSRDNLIERPAWRIEDAGEDPDA